LVGIRRFPNRLIHWENSRLGRTDAFIFLQSLARDTDHTAMLYAVPDGTAYALLSAFVRGAYGFRMERWSLSHPVGEGWR